MGRPKHLLPVGDDRTMIEVIADTMTSVCARLVVIGPDDALPQLPHVLDRRADQGPLAGLEALLLDGDDDQFLVCPCDVPAVSVALLSALTTSVDEPVTVLRFPDEPQPRPLPIRISACIIESVTARLNAGRRAVHGLLDVVDTHVVDAPTEWRAALHDVNAPEDYERLAPSD